MKAYTAIGACVAALLLVAGFCGGYEMGVQNGQAAGKGVAAGVAEQQLALDLEVLHELDHGDLAKARWMIQASTAGRLGDIIEHSDFGEASRLRFRCQLLEKYKQYDAGHRLFDGPAWRELLEVEGMKEAVRRRRVFMDDTLPALCEAP